MFRRVIFVSLLAATSALAETVDVEKKSMVRAGIVCYDTVQTDYFANAFKKSTLNGWERFALEKGRSWRSRNKHLNAYCSLEKYVIGVVETHERHDNVSIYRLRLTYPVRQIYTTKDGWGVVVIVEDQVVYVIEPTGDVPDLERNDHERPEGKERRVWFIPLAAR